MSAAKFFGGDFPPGLDFDPADEDLIKLYLLPRVRGHPDPFPGLVIEDDKAANTQPWKLFPLHKLPLADDVTAFFYVRNNTAKPDARPSRSCDGGGTWKSQRSVGKNKDNGHVLLVGGEKIGWIRHSLNFDMGSGSVGWVMHEYTITDHPSLKICRISFSGHGQKRMLVPDDSSLAGEPATKSPRIADDDSGSASWTTATTYQQYLLGTAHASADRERTTQDSSHEEIGYAQPSWEFQEQHVQTVEQLGQLPPSAPQEPAQVFSADQHPPSASGMLNQDSCSGSAPSEDLDLLSADKFAEVMNFLADLPNDGSELYQQFGQQAPASTMPHKVDQDSSAGLDQWDLDPFSEDQIADMMDMLAEIPDEQAPAGNDGGAEGRPEMMIPSFWGAQDMDKALA